MRSSGRSVRQLAGVELDPSPLGDRLVGREPDPDDGRAQLLRLTEEGARRVDEVDARRREWYEGRLSDWGAAEIGDLAERLGAYNRALDSD